MPCLFWSAVLTRILKLKSAGYVCRELGQDERFCVCSGFIIPAVVNSKALHPTEERTLWPGCSGLPWQFRWLKFHLQCGRPRFDLWVGKIPWRREWLPTLVFLPGEFHGQRSLGGYSPWGCKESDMTESLSTLWVAMECATFKLGFECHPMGKQENVCLARRI